MDANGSTLISGEGTLRVVGLPPTVGRIYGGGNLTITGIRNQLFDEVWFDSELVQGIIGPSPLWRPQNGY